MLQRIRVSMEELDKQLMTVISEIDEAFLGVVEKNRHFRYKINKPRKKAVVIGIVNRGTKQVVARKV